MSKTAALRMNEIDVRVEPYSGADVNLMDEHQYKALLNRSEKKPGLEVSKIKLSTLQNELPVKGEFVTTLRNKTCGTLAKIVVIRGHINSPPLISKGTLMELGMLEIREDGSLGQPNHMKIQDATTSINTVTSSEETSDECSDKSKDSSRRTVGGDTRDGSCNVDNTTIRASKQAATKGNTETSGETTSDQIKDNLERYSHVFSGIGRIRDVKNDEEFYVSFSMKAEVAQVAQKPRPVPYYLQKPLKQWLDQAVEEDLFEYIPQGQPVIWGSPLVVQPKPRFSNTPQEQLESHMIGASVDLRVPNKFMERNRIIQRPVVEDFSYKFHDCVIFSKLDLRHGYLQLVSHPDSREVVTFSTP